MYRVYLLCCCAFFFFKQKTAYEMRISDWSSDVCSSDLLHLRHTGEFVANQTDAGQILLRCHAGNAGIVFDHDGVVRIGIVRNHKRGANQADAENAVEPVDRERGTQHAAGAERHRAENHTPTGTGAGAPAGTTTPP